jgi:hypothetical protein
MTISLDNIYPLIVPANYYVKGTWELPHQTLPNQSFILTWVTFGSGTTMNYLTQEQYQELNNKQDSQLQTMKTFSVNLKWVQADKNCFGFVS